MGGRDLVGQNLLGVQGFGRWSEEPLTEAEKAGQARFRAGLREQGITPQQDKHKTAGTS